MSAIIYAEGFKVVLKPVTRRGPSWNQMLPGQGADGYGKKISTDRVLVFPDSKKQYRVYATCFSNCASHWIVKNGQTLHLRDTDLS